MRVTEYLAAVKELPTAEQAAFRYSHIDPNDEKTRRDIIQARKQIKRSGAILGDSE